jgi:hypothetical protein
LVRGMYCTVKRMGSSCCFVVLVAWACVYICEGRISDKRLCGDPTCSGTIRS